MSKIIYKDESYATAGALFDVYNNLGSGFSEIVYKDALSKHKFYADFVVFDKIILEKKSTENLHDKQTAQSLNYLKVSQCKLAILANFHKDLLDHNRIVL